MQNPYYQQIDIVEVRRLQKLQYQDAIPMEQSIAANSQTDIAVNITSVGHFMMLSMTGEYTTLSLDQETPADDGINYLFIQLVDGSNQRVLFDDFIPASLFLSPGRYKSLAVGSDSNPLRLEFPFVYTFDLNSQITVRVRNSSDAANNLRMMFKGIRILAKNRQGL